MKPRNVLILLFLLCSTLLFGKDKLFLQQQNKPGKQRQFNLDREYTSQAGDFSYCTQTLLHTDSSLSILPFHLAITHSLLNRVSHKTTFDLATKWKILSVKRPE